MDMIKPIDGTHSAGTKVFIRADANEEGAKTSCWIIQVKDQAVHCTDSSWGIRSSSYSCHTVPTRCR